MEDRYDIRVDVGDGKDWWYVHGLATHDKVYELNKQMCDIDKHLSEAGYFRMICDGQIETRKKLIDMKEKKMNPMTKAEAFEWLKGKKVYANGKGKEVQMKLFECGVGWATNHFVYYDFGDYLLIETDGRLYHCGHEGDSYWRAHHFKEISADDIISIEILEDKNNEFVDCSEPCPEIKAVQELLRNSNHLKDKIIVITKDNAAIL